ncbi:MAG: hypothetical protein R6U62_05895 [Bacteroidales bacterium]
MVHDEKQQHWQWRYDMAQRMAEALPMPDYGVKALYLIGSVKTGHVGPCSDIDLLAYCSGDAIKHKLLSAWCEGWGLCLAAIHYQKTGYKIRGSLVDLHIITDEDIKQKSSFAAMLDSLDNRPKLLRKD